MARYEPTGQIAQVNWCSSDESVAIVDDGTVEAVGIGTCTIMAMTKDRKYIAVCEVTV